MTSADTHVCMWKTQKRGEKDDDNSGIAAGRLSDGLYL